MPPTRRKSNQTARAQPTLSFNSRAAKITKPSVSSSKASKTAKKTAVLDTDSTPSTPTAEGVVDPNGDERKTAGTKGETTSELAIREQVAAEKKEEKSEAEERAKGVSDAQVRRYWKGKEEGRKAPRGRLTLFAGSRIVKET